MYLLQSNIEQNFLPIIVGVAGIIIALLAIVFLIFFVFARNRQNNLLLEQERLNAVFKQQLLQSQLEIQEQTFNIISQEIHDNVGQSLSLAKMQLHILDRGEVYDKALVEGTTDSVSKAITDLRDIAKSLNSDRIQQSSLSDIISQELSRINRSGFLQTNITTEGTEQDIQNQKKLIVFRIVQEALQNILKHANAANIYVKCEYGQTSLQIMVADNGKGFNKNLLTKKDGLGLLNIMNRAALIGGEANIESFINRGTTITIVAPYV